MYTRTHPSNSRIHQHWRGQRGHVSHAHTIPGKRAAGDVYVLIKPGRGGGGGEWEKGSGGSRQWVAGEGKT